MDLTESTATLPVRIGIDIGSTTVKVAILDENDKLIYGDYQRHRADIRNTIIVVVSMRRRVLPDAKMKAAAFPGRP